MTNEEMEKRINDINKNLDLIKECDRLYDEIMSALDLVEEE